MWIGAARHPHLDGPDHNFDDDHAALRGGVPLGNVDEPIKDHLDRVVRGSGEETLNALLDAEADRLCNAQRYERSEARRDTRAGHYERRLHTKAGEVRLKVPGSVNWRDAARSARLDMPKAKAPLTEGRPPSGYDAYELLNVLAAYATTQILRPALPPVLSRLVRWIAERRDLLLAPIAAWPRFPSHLVRTDKIHFQINEATVFLIHTHIFYDLLLRCIARQRFHLVCRAPVHF